MNSQHVQLLVSIRNRNEILPALDGGCDILDLKEPSNGALGMVNEETLHSISDYFINQPVKVPLSLALGELVEWKVKRSTLIIPEEFTYLKMGLSETAQKHNWYSDWVNLKQQIEEKNKATFQWIAVAYADWKQANAISPQEVLTAAIESQCAGFLIDTFHKQGQSLLDSLSLAEIQKLIDRAQSHKLKIALAGSITYENLEMLSNVSPDIIGIRGAACLWNQRTNQVQKLAVKKFRKQLDRQYTFMESG